jgi:hypothetical protein
LAVDEVVESMIQLEPGGSEWAAMGDVRRERGVEQRETRSEDSGVGLGEEYGNAAAERGQLVAMGTWQPSDQCLAPESS